MKNKEKETECCQGKFMGKYHHGKCNCGGQSGAIYGLGMIGALFYFLQSAVGFGAIMLGIGKAIFWPALVVFKVLGMLGI